MKNTSNSRLTQTPDTYPGTRLAEVLTSRCPCREKKFVGSVKSDKGKQWRRIEGWYMKLVCGSCQLHVAVESLSDGFLGSELFRHGRSIKSLYFAADWGSLRSSLCANPLYTSGQAQFLKGLGSMTWQCHLSFVLDLIWISRSLVLGSFYFKSPCFHGLAIEERPG